MTTKIKNATTMIQATINVTYQSVAFVMSLLFTSLYEKDIYIILAISSNILFTQFV